MNKENGDKRAQFMRRKAEHASFLLWEAFGSYFMV